MFQGDLKSNVLIRFIVLGEKDSNMQYQELSISLSYSPVVFYAPMTRWAKPPLVTPLTIKEEGWFTMRYSTGCTSLELMIILMTVSGYNELQVKFKPWWSGPSPRSPRWCQKYTCKVPKHHQDEEFWIDQSSFGGYFPSVLWMSCVISWLQKSIPAKIWNTHRLLIPLG